MKTVIEILKQVNASSDRHEKNQLRAVVRLGATFGPVLMTVLATTLGMSVAFAPGVARAADPALPDVSHFMMPTTNNNAQPTERKKPARKTVAKKKAASSTEKTEPDATQLSDKANHELTVDEKNKQLGIGVSSGVLTTNVEAVESPYKNPAFQLGLMVQSYSPVGHSQVEGADPFELNGLGAQPMCALEVRYMPFTASGPWSSDLGFVASVGYAQHALDLKSPTGLAVDNAHLQTIISEIKFADRFHFTRAPRWTLLAALGAGDMESIQSANSSLANNSSSLKFLAASLEAEYALTLRWSLTAGYEYRGSTTAIGDGIGIQNNNFLVGFLGSFR